MTLIEIFLALVCHGGVCHVDRIYVTPEAMAVASCESGDGWNYGTYDFTARSVTDDGGAWQFNDATALWLTGQDHAETWSPAMQYATFVRLWDDGAGWRHWTASKPCWGRWLDIVDDRAVMKEDAK